MKRKNKIEIICCLVISLLSCKSETKEKGEVTIDKKEHRLIQNEVTIQLLKQKAFKKEIVSNGKLIALQKNILKFEIGERLEKLYVQNGALVKKNQRLAKLRDYDFRQQVDKATSNFLKAELDFKDQLLGRGYNFENKDSIPTSIYNMVSIRSGYKDAERELQKAKHELKSIELIAPFRGKVANIQYKQFEQVSAGREFLTLIDDTFFEVAFYLIESEIKDIQVNDEVVAKPFALDKKYQGKVTSINPMVERNGTVLVKAAVKNDGDLIEGMNTRIIIQKDIPEQFVVPKEAVVLRQNKEVLFKVVNGKAYWTYVLTTNENSRNYSVIPHPDKSSAHLAVEDSIIVSGNLNLAHDSEVSVRKKKK